MEIFEKYARVMSRRTFMGRATTGIGSMALNASSDGKPLYEAMGYAESASPMMFLPIVRV